MINQIYEAYLQVVTEEVMPKFKVGDQVGVGSHGHLNQYDYSAHGTGKVVKVHKNGDHTVELDNPPTPGVVYHGKVTKNFDHTGKSKLPYDHAKLSTIEDHHKMIKAVADKRERAEDLRSIRTHLDSHYVGAPGSGSTTYTKLSKESAAHMKAMIDKHTAED